MATSSSAEPSLGQRLARGGDDAREAARLLGNRPRKKRPPENLRVRFPLDPRTKLGKAAKEFRAALLAHVGPTPTVTALALVQLCVEIKSRLAVMDDRFYASGGDMSAHDTRQYLAWTNSLARTLLKLGVEGAPVAPPSLVEALHAGASAAAGARSALAAPNARDVSERPPSTSYGLPP